MCKMMYRSIAAVCLSLGLSGATMADEGVYLFAEYNSSQSDMDLSGLSRVDDDATGFLVGGGYSFGAHFALELAYQDFGRHDGETDCPPDIVCLIVPAQTRADLHSLSLSAVARFPIGERLSIYGRLGISSWDVGYDGLNSVFDESGEDLLIGAGVDGSLNERWSLFAEYRQVDIDIKSVGLGVRYSF